MQCTSKCEWQIQAPWGNITLIAWGNPLAYPVFLVHGRQDCAATFQPLLELMPPEEFYYVSIDMPGSGNSDHFPNDNNGIYSQQDENHSIGLRAKNSDCPPDIQQPLQCPDLPSPELKRPSISPASVMIMRFHFVSAIEAAIQHLGWTQFMFVGHSMGAELGLFYNSVYPGRITKMVLLDPEPSLRRLQIRELAEYQKKFYDNYYDNYIKDNFQYRTYTIPEAIQALMKARSITEDKAALIVSRSLKHVKGDQYRFSWDRRLKMPAPQNYPNEYYYELFKNLPVALIVSAEDSLNAKSDSGSLELLDSLCSLNWVKHVIVKGKHDVHLNSPKRVAHHVLNFLREVVYYDVVSKL